MAPSAAINVISMISDESTLYLQHQCLLLCFLQLLFGGVQRAVQAPFLCRQPHAAFLRLQLLAFNLIKANCQR